MLPYEMTNEHSMEEYRKKIKKINDLIDKYNIRAIANEIRENKERQTMNDMLTLVFDYKEGDAPTLIVGRKDKDGSIHVIQIIVGESATRIYCDLSSRNPDIFKTF